MNIFRPIPSSNEGAATRFDARDHRTINLTSLRALTALSVATFHFARPGYFEDGSPLPWYLRTLRLSMISFFVISGFLVPLMIERMEARPGPFLLRRWLRLHPPFLVTCALIIGLNFLSSLSPLFKGPPPSTDLSFYAANFCLVGDIVGTGWLNPAFWTLAMEAQFSLLLALCFPVLTRSSQTRRLSILALFILLPLIPGLTPSGWVVGLLPVYACGVSLYLEHKGLISKPHTLIVLLAALAVNFHMRDVHAFLSIAFSIFWIRVIPPLRLPVLPWVAGISYSMYLLHIPIGGRMINLIDRWATSESVHILGLIVTMATCLAVAWCFNRYVEQPAHRLSKKLNL